MRGPPARFFLRKAGVGSLFILLMLICTIYWAGLSGPFIFDDYPNLVDNDWLDLRARTPMDWRSAALSSESSVLRRPLPMFSFALQISSAGELTAWASKAVNLAIHVFCVVLVFLLTGEIVRAPLARLAARQRSYLPLLTAAVWGLNPLHVSTVLYPVQRMAMLSTLFSFLAMFVFLRFRNRWVAQTPSGDQLVACALWFLLLLLCAIYSKENAALVPWLAVTVEVIFFRGYIGGDRPRQMQWMSWLVFLVPTAMALLLIAINLDWIRAGYAVRPFDLTERLLTELRILWAYVLWFAVPRLDALGMFHDDIVLSTSWLRPAFTAFAAMAWAGILAVALALVKKLPELLFAVLFFLIGHIIESSVLALELVFEHRNYLPSFAMALLLTASSTRLIEWLRARGVSPVLALMPLFLFVGSLAFTTALRADIWSSELAMSRAAVEHHPRSPRSGLFYASTLLKEGMATSETSDAAQLLGLARHEFELVEQSQREQLAALVMLYILDEQLYQNLGTAERWLQRIERSVGDVTPSTTDFVALGSLVDCYETGSCSIERERLISLLAVFEENAVRKSAVATLKNRVLKADESGDESRLASLAAALERTPNDIRLRYRRMEVLLRLRRFGTAHAEAVALMRVDENRRQLPVMRDTFAPRKRQAESPDA